MRIVKSAILIILGFVLFPFEPVSCEDSTRPDWYVYSAEYIQHDDEIAKLFTREAATAKEFEDLNNYRDEAKKNFIKSVPPSDKEIKTLLSSSSNKDVNIGVVSIYLSEAFSKELADSLIKILTSIKDTSTESYVLLCFSKAPSEVVRSYETELLDYIQKTDASWMLFAKSKILLKLPPDKSAVILSDWLGRDSRLVKRIAYIYLGQLGPEYQDNALDNLVKTKKIDKEKFLDDLFGDKQQRPQAN